jgi:hypothetical protein
MLDKTKQIISHPIFCYSPALIYLAFLINFFWDLKPFVCWFKIDITECIIEDIFSQFTSLIFGILILFLFFYTCFYLYYAIVLGDNLVGKSIKITYPKIIKKFKVKNKYKDFCIFLTCYLASLIFSYFFVLIIICKKRL